MAPKPIIDLAQVDLSRVEYDAEALDTYLPQTDVMRQLHGVIKHDPEARLTIGYRDVRGDEFWTKGHFASRPVFPGVLLVESLAQLCSFYWRREIGLERAPGRVMLFGGLDAVKFRDAVFPGQRVILVCKVDELKERRSTYDCQAFVEGKLVFEGRITGLLGPAMPEVFKDGR
jgi:3-hydroxyacyl-[acyl-carrier-protein] dehydratase